MKGRKEKAAAGCEEGESVEHNRTRRPRRKSTPSSKMTAGREWNRSSGAEEVLEDKKMPSLSLSLSLLLLFRSLGGRSKGIRRKREMETASADVILRKY
jgi:hypothetical protein